MIGKQVVSERAVTLTEVKSILEKRKDKGELTYEQKVSLEYAQDFANAGVKKAKETTDSLKELGIDEKAAAKIVDVQPKTKEELKLIFEKTRFKLSEDSVKKILDIAAKL